MSGDAYHMTATPSEGEGAARSMVHALKDAGVKPEQVNYINAHGTSTSVGDLSELRAVKSIFGDAPKNCCMSSTKSMTGHLLGAAGAIEAVITVMSIKDQICPPTINLQNPEDEVGDLILFLVQLRNMILSTLCQITSVSVALTAHYYSSVLMTKL